MGLKDWLTKRSGPTGYGDAMGRQAVENGIALGRFLFLGHGTHPKRSSVSVFEDEDKLRTAGFSLYCTNAQSSPPAENSSDLYRQTRAAGIALAVRCSIAAAYNFMREGNASAFSRSMGQSTRDAMERQNLDITSDMVMRYLRLQLPAGVTHILNFDTPGTGDAFGLYLDEIRKNDERVAFRRTGVLGFDLLAKPLAAETVRGISEAAQKFQW
jgi:hypothetical protein